jgi:Subtilase family
MPTPKRRKKRASEVPARVAGPRVAPDHRGFLVVRLRQTPRNRSINQLEVIPEIAELFHTFGVRPASPLIRSFALEELRQRERDWKVTPEKSLAAYWRLDTRHLEPGRIQELRKALEKLPDVELAYVDPPASIPVSPANDRFVKRQRYLNKAPTGIDAKWAWTQTGGSGLGVRVVDLEGGWHTHVDLPTIQLLPGVSVEVDGALACRHGTMVLGIIASLDNTKGYVGIAPDATISVASHWRSDPTGGPTPVNPNACSRPSDLSLGGHVASTITSLLPHLTAGDVLLLEIQKEHPILAFLALPTELVAADFDAIEIATNQGIVVVECAGNNGEDLDQFPELDRNQAQFRDSGAIMVAGCEAKVSTKIVAKATRTRPAKKLKGHKPWIGSNVGSRIDCHAWGEKVATTGLNPALGSIYVRNFAGTSAAGAIVAGAVAVVQSARKANGQAPLSPQQMRDVLTTTGTPQYPSTKKIGTMPNLKKAIPAALALP